MSMPPKHLLYGNAPRGRQTVTDTQTPHAKCNDQQCFVTVCAGSSWVVTVWR